MRTIRRFRRFLFHMIVLGAPAAMRAQFPGGPTGPPTAQAQPAPVIPNLSPGQVQGSAGSGVATPEVVILTLDDTIARALKNNLGILVRDAGSATARANRIRALGGLLPNVQGSISENVQQTNLQALGINIPFAPKIVGPFGYTDVRASASMSLFDWTVRRNLKTSEEGVRAAALSRRDAEDVVVQAVSNAYFLVSADAAQIRSVAAQIEVAKALYNQALDQKAAGTGTGLDATRALVQLKSQQQILLAQQDQLDKDKLALARLIGLPLAQRFELADRPTEAAGDLPEAADAVTAALATRADFHSLESQVKAAELAVSAARAQRYPALSMNGNYGVIGPNLARSHGTFTFTGSLKFNLFDGNRIEADVAQAEAALSQRRSELADLKGQVEYQVRAAILDLKSAREQVEVARAGVELAKQSLGQSRERFTAGVTNTVEVVQAQQQVAAAEQSLIAALYIQNVARSALKRAMGGNSDNGRAK